MIRYKVVIRKTRESIIGMLHNRPKKSSYILKYKKGTIVTAPKNTVGILVFKTLSNAEKFMEIYSDPTYYKILKIEGIGKGKTIKRLFSDGDSWGFFTSLVVSVFNENPMMQKMSAPVGTMAYKAVRVLE